MTANRRPARKLQRREILLLASRWGRGFGGEGLLDSLDGLSDGVRNIFVGVVLRESSEVGQGRLGRGADCGQGRGRHVADNGDNGGIVTQGGNERLHGPGVADLAQAAASRGADVGVIVPQGGQERLDGVGLEVLCDSVAQIALSSQRVAQVVVGWCDVGVKLALPRL